jgi:hypothetical protein
VRLEKRVELEELLGILQAHTLILQGFPEVVVFTKVDLVVVVKVGQRDLPALTGHDDLVLEASIGFVQSVIAIDVVDETVLKHVHDLASNFWVSSVSIKALGETVKGSGCACFTRVRDGGLTLDCDFSVVLEVTSLERENLELAVFAINLHGALFGVVELHTPENSAHCFFE